MTSSYPNRYSRSKNWHQILFSGGRYLQAPEMNEMQLIAKQQHRDFADVLFENGTLMRDGEISIDVDSSMAQVAAGAIYIDGEILDVAENRAVSINIVGTMTVGVWLAKAIITEEEDSNLLDTSDPNLFGYEQPGAARQSLTIEWGTSNDAANGRQYFAIYELRDGELVRNVRPPEIRGIQQTLATRDFEVNGSYLVRGFQLVVVDVLNQGDDTTPLTQQIRFSISSGLARVEGFRIERLVETILPIFNGIPESNDGPSIARRENEFYQMPALSADMMYEIVLNYSPITRVTQVTAPGISNEISFTVPGSDPNQITFSRHDIGIGLIPEGADGIFSCTADRRGDLTAVTVFIPPSSIMWNSNVPYQGTTVRIRFTIQRDYDPATDEEISVNYRNNSIELRGNSFDNTVGRPVTVDYEYALPRWDFLVMDRDLTFQFIKGTSTENLILKPLDRLRSDRLLLAEVYHTWRIGEFPTVRQLADGAVSQPVIAEMREAITELTLDLLQEKIYRQLNTEESRQKVGQFIDPLLDYSQVILQGKATDNIAIQDGELQIAVHTQQFELDLVTEPQTLERGPDVIVLQQELITDGLLINRYANFDPVPALVTLKPSVDTWTVDRSERRVVEQQRIVRNTLTRTIGSGNASRTTTSQTASSRLTTALNLVNVQRRPVEFMRQRQILVDIDVFRPNEQVSRVTVGDIEVTPANPPTAPSNGQIRDMPITIPGDAIPAGEIVIRVEGAEGGTTGEAIYTARGEVVTQQWIETRTTIQTLTTVVTRRRFRRRVDPLAQTFLLTDARQVVGISVYIHTVGNVSNTVQLQIRETAEGDPTQTILADAVLSAVQLVAGTWQRANFRSPIYLEANTEYAIVVLTNDNQHQLGIARIGDVTAGNRIVSKQPYTVGVLLSSSNASTWTAIQEADMAFRIHAATYTGTTRDVLLGRPQNGTLPVTDLLPSVPVFLPNPSTNVSMIVASRATGNGVDIHVPRALGTPNNRNVVMPTTARLEGTATLSPIVFPGGILAAGTLGGNAIVDAIDPIARVEYHAQLMVDTLTTATSTIIFRCEVLLPSGYEQILDVDVHARKADEEEVGKVNAKVGLGGLATIAIAPNDWQPVTVTLATSGQSDTASVRMIDLAITIRGTSGHRPRLRQLRMIRVAG